MRKDELLKKYPIGSRVKLLKMDDVQAPPIGTKGTVVGVDDIGSILVSWDNGSSLNVVDGVDKVKKIDVIKTICYGQEKLFDSKREALDFYFEAVSSSEGAERERYENIIHQLNAGKTYCLDSEN